VRSGEREETEYSSKRSGAADGVVGREAWQRSRDSGGRLGVSALRPGAGGREVGALGSFPTGQCP
jgi:hypothetical protein